MPADAEHGGNQIGFVHILVGHKVAVPDQQLGRKFIRQLLDRLQGIVLLMRVVPNGDFRGGTCPRQRK